MSEHEGQHNAENAAIEVGSLWRRNPPGREVVRVERCWRYDAEGLTVRAHPTTGGRPLVAPVTYLREHYTEVPNA
jgi:hypothetical protein